MHRSIHNLFIYSYYLFRASSKSLYLNLKVLKYVLFNCELYIYTLFKFLITTNIAYKKPSEDS